MEGKSDIVYHYCSTESFFKIIKSKHIWLSDLAQSNDSQEGKVAIDLWVDELKKHHNCTKKQLQLIRKLYELRLSAITCFGISFSKQKDLLSQWRGYGDDGKGFSIGFSKSWLKSRASPQGMRTIAVDYINKYDSEKVPLYGEDLFKSLPADEEIDLDTISKTSHSEAYALFHTLGTEIPFYLKSSFFHEEAEYRLMYQKEKTHCETEPKIHYRCSNNRIVPYIELSLLDNNVNKSGPPIREIWRGPKNTVPDDIIKSLLKKNRFEPDIDPKIEIRHSGGSYQ